MPYDYIRNFQAITVLPMLIDACVYLIYLSKSMLTFHFTITASKTIHLIFTRILKTSPVLRITLI